MSIFNKVIAGSFLAATLFSIPTGAKAVEVNIGVGLPQIFYPEPEFRYEGGYYRTIDNHYYYYDAERRGWHYGRNREEGLKEERRRERLERERREREERHERHWR